MYLSLLFSRPSLFSLLSTFSTRLIIGRAMHHGSSSSSCLLPMNAVVERKQALRVVSCTVVSLLTQCMIQSWCWVLMVWWSIIVLFNGSVDGSALFLSLSFFAHFFYFPKIITSPKFSISFFRSCKIISIQFVICPCTQSWFKISLWQFEKKWVVILLGPRSERKFVDVSACLILR